MRRVSIDRLVDLSLKSHHARDFHKRLLDKHHHRPCTIPVKNTSSAENLFIKSHPQRSPPINPQNPSQGLREADSLKATFQPILRQRKPRVSLPGISTFSAAHNASPAPTNLPTPNYSRPNHSYSSGFQFRPPLTPQSIPRSTSHLPHPNAPSPLALSASMDNDDPFHSSDLPDLSPDYPDFELDGLAPDSYFSRRQKVNTCTKINLLLADLRKDRISPLDILIQVLDPDDMAYDWIKMEGNDFEDQERC
ncbi:hypothetical protein B0H13DRAFT_2310231 [Mycena leptocephala]|nr:hypothetical protein B0H13DRAFT_2310231 [Mycena leptocephala]